jgi:TnpA family transposase
LKKGYEALAGNDSEQSPEGSDISETEFTNNFNNDSDEEIQTPENQENNTNLNSRKNKSTSVVDARQEYEKAYKAYTRAMISGADSEEITKKLQAYREAFERYRAVVSTVQNNR